MEGGIETMKYLAISHNPNYMAWAYFDGRVLYAADKIYFNDYKPHKQMYEFYKYIVDIIRNHEIGVLIVKKLHENGIMKIHLERYFNLRGILKLIASQEKMMYVEAKTDGWELYITKGKNTNKKKLDIVNKGYGLPFVDNKENFFTDDVEIANAIILGEAMSRKRLQV